jgi:hypothetical protein
MVIVQQLIQYFLLLLYLRAVGNQFWTLDLELALRLYVWVHVFQI